MTNGFVRVVTSLAGLMGAAGVALAAMAAHAGDAARLGPASTMLLFHAPAAMAAALVTAHGMVQRPLGITACFGFIAGASLFSGDLVFRHYAGNALFPFAAPTGGSLLILSWIVLAIAALWSRRAG
ncbi:MAG: DUF423 domain-containing protein [Afipia sp.]|nr:DUF423 domain-containing protein [Afipia sp.]